MLELDIDPKLAWALAHRDRFPVDMNRGRREMLLRVPGPRHESRQAYPRCASCSQRPHGRSSRLRVPLAQGAAVRRRCPDTPRHALLDSLKLDRAVRRTAEQLDLFGNDDARMNVIRLAGETDFDRLAQALRVTCVCPGMPPEDVEWAVGDASSIIR